MENEILDDSIISPEVKLVAAEKGKRFANLLIDYVGMLLFLFVVMFVLDFIGLLSMDAMENGFAGNVVSWITYVVYYALFESLTNGKTLGKYVTKTRVVNYEGYQPELSSILGRSLARIVPFEAFSFLGQKMTGWHDDWSKTFVIDEKRSTLPNEGFL